MSVRSIRSTSYDIVGLAEDSIYSITVTATNAVRSIISNAIIAKTQTSGKTIVNSGCSMTAFYI